MRLLIHNVSKKVPGIEHHDGPRLQSSEISDPTDVDPTIPVIPATPVAISSSLTNSTLVLSQMSTSSALPIALPTVWSLSGKDLSISMLTGKMDRFRSSARPLARFSAHPSARPLA